MSINLSTYTSNVQSVNESVLTKQLHFRKKFSDKRKENFYRELGMLLRSGVDFKKALEILSGQIKNQFEKKLIQDLKNKVVDGKGIFEAMKISGQFSAYEYYSVQIGEETRRLDEVLSELQIFFNRKIQMRRQIISVLTYPCIVLIVTFLVLYFMLNNVVPMFSSVFRQFGSELPKSTQYIVLFSKHSGLAFGVLAGFIIGFIIIHQTFKSHSVYRKFMSALILKIPYFGNLIKTIYISRFCQSMKLLISSKTPLILSLTLTEKMISFYPIEVSIEYIRNDITKGVSFSESLNKHSVYENKLVSMIDIAEQVNQLDIMFERLSDQYNDDINHKTKMIGVILEPMIIIVIGIVVGIIMISMYAPMFDLSKILNN